MDGIVITDMRTAAASAVATKVRRETDLNYGYTNAKPIVAYCDLFYVATDF